MLEACEHQSSFCVYGVFGGSPDWGGRSRLRSRPMAEPLAIEGAPVRFSKPAVAAGESGQESLPPQR
jgi:hypothetical protein